LKVFTNKCSTKLKFKKMKKLFLLIPTLFCFTSFAVVRTVSNNPATLAQFSTIQAAIDASATSGDQIYVHGSPNTYAAFTITNKQITIIGPGWAPDKTSALTANVAGCTFSGASTANTELQGLVFTTTIQITDGNPDGLRFIRNRFLGLDININQGGVTYQDYLFEGNSFDNATVNATSSSNYTNFLFQNNYFYENGTVRDGNLGGQWLNCTNVLFDHNLWFGPGSSTRNISSGSSFTFLNFSNNIFVRRNFNSRISSSTFTNNITFNCGDNTPWIGNGNNGPGNIPNTDPQMVDQASVNAGTNNLLANYTIAAGDANNGGSDDKDIGLLFDAVGSLNWANSRNSRLPRIFSMSVITPTVQAGGTVTVNVDARVSN
jgi:hypothetical protein